MRVSELCRSKPGTCAPDMNLSEAVARLWECDSGALTVVDAEGRPLALVTDRDIAIALGTRDVPASSLLVKDVMTRRLYTCLADDEVRNAIRIMIRNGVRRLPVIDSEARLVGMLSVNDLVLAARPMRIPKGGDDLVWADLVPALEVLYRPSRARLPEKAKGEADVLVPA